MSKTPPDGYSGRGKSFGNCHYCTQTFTASALEVDHKKQAGTCNSWDTSQEFLHNLLNCNDNWLLACKPCHKVKSYAERTGASFEEAAAAKKVIEFMKKPTAEVVAFLKTHGQITSNAVQRRAALTKIFKGE